MAKKVLIFWGIKVANFCQEVLNFLGSYTRVFIVQSTGHIFGGLILGRSFPFQEHVPKRPGLIFGILRYLTVIPRWISRPM